MLKRRRDIHRVLLFLDWKRKQRALIILLQKLILLDVKLPVEDGMTLTRELRARSGIPIIMLTSRKDDVDRILGLELGADDYLTKPFNPRELLARIRSLLRRASYGTKAKEGMDVMTFAGWRIDPLSRELHDPEGAEVSMTTAEFDIILAFCNNPGRVMTREELLAMTHAGTAGPVQRSIDVHVSRVRQKIEPNLKEHAFIKTVRLGGYLFAPTVEKAK